MSNQIFNVLQSDWLKFLMHINVKSPTQESYFAEFARVGGLRFFASTTVNQRRIQEASPDKLLFKNVQLTVRTRLRQYLKVCFPSKGKIITVAPLHHGHVWDRRKWPL